MTVSLNIRGDASRILADLEQLEDKVVRKIAGRAINKAARDVRTQSLRKISHTFDVPRAALTGKKDSSGRVRGRRFFLSMARRGQMTAAILALVLPLLSSRVGKPRQPTRKAAARSGRHQWPGAFAATMRSGYVGIFKRRGRERLPIVEQTVDIEPGASNIIRVEVETTGARSFQREFERLARVEIGR